MDNQVEEIKQRLNLVEVIQEYVKLTPAGTNYKANCPFHQEKTPSFMVSEDKQIWHCFGCGEGGDVFGFVMKMEGMTFPETLRLLAEKAGVQLRRRNPENENRNTRLLEINQAAAGFYHQTLLERPEAQPARDYLKERGVLAETLEEFEIGFALKAWDELGNFLRSQGYSDDETFSAGLTIKKDKGNGHYDRFRGRIMFPLADAHGRVVGFGGRILPSLDDGQSGKYVNSPQTAIYNKSTILFALNLAKQEIKNHKIAVVVEGYMDALSSHQAGIKHVVASGGTALTNEQIRLLKRYASAVALSFDMDPAGFEAAKRGLEVAWQQEMETRVIQLPFGKDPDECIRRDPAAWQRAVEQAKPFMDYFFAKTLADHPPATVQGKKDTAKILLPLIARLPDPIEKSHYLQQLANAINVPEQALQDKLRQTRPGQTVRTQAVANVATTMVKNRPEQLTDLVLGLLLLAPDQLEGISQRLEPEQLRGENRDELYKQMIIYYTKNQHFGSEEFVQSLVQHSPTLTQLAERLRLYAQSQTGELSEPVSELARKTFAEALPFLKRHQLLDTISRLERQLHQAEADRKTEAIDTLTKEITHLTESISQSE
ncbi:MAG: DNA primase [Patescibacteria group bacterium]|jgi:DNA primase